MPSLKKIVVQNWRNIELQELDFSPKVNCISGNNGEGKTNLLDAIYYLSMTKSAFGPSDQYNFRHGCRSFALAGNYCLEDGSTMKISIQVEQNQEKKLVRDGKACSKMSEHIGLLPIVMISPCDSALVSEGSEARRKFATSVLSQMDREYLSAMQRYNKLLAQRNASLKGSIPSFELLDALDINLSRMADKIFQSRRDFAQGLQPLVQSYYEKLSSGKESVGIEYVSDLHTAALYELLQNCRDKDSFLHYTSKGVQRDDFLFTMNGEPIRKTGSQGQQKCFLVALKFAQYELMKLSYGFAPALLLDDMFDKLDIQRTENLLQMVAGKDFGQIFISDTNKARLQGIVDKFTCESSYFEAEGGVFKK